MGLKSWVRYLAVEPTSTSLQWSGLLSEWRGLKEFNQQFKAVRGFELWLYARIRTDAIPLCYTQWEVIAIKPANLKYILVDRWAWGDIEMSLVTKDAKEGDDAGTLQCLQETS